MTNNRLRARGLARAALAGAVASGAAGAALAQFVEPTRIIHEWRGEGAGDQFGWIARSIGDVDGDGANDVVVSAPTNAEGGENAGRIYVYSSAGGERLWTATGHAGWRLGLSVEAAGDVNADGVPDVIAGAPGGGRAIVYSGADGGKLLTLRSGAANDFFGRGVSDVGDWNGDGHDDVLVGAQRHDGAAGEDAGRAYLFSGKDGVALLTLDGERAGDLFGSQVAGLARDGTRMLVIGAQNAGEGRRGRVYVYKGQKPSLAFTIDADATGTQLGRMFISIVGDVDADGAADVYASDWNDAALGRDTGRIYVHSGATGARLLALGGEAAGDGFGIGVADAGDVNGDGRADLVIGAWRQASGAPSGGRVYILSGADGSRLRTITCNVKNDTFGFDATGVGDVNGDGAIDFLLTSAWSEVCGEKCGRAFIIAGESAPRR